MRTRQSIAAIVIGLICIALFASGVADATTKPTSTQAILRAGVIFATDVPSAWTAGPHPKKNDQSLQGIPACNAVIAADAAAERTAAQARSATFTDPTNPAKTTSAENTVFAFKNAATARRYLTVYQTSTAAECQRASVGRQIGPQATTTVSPITDLGKLGDGRVGDEIVVQGTTSNGQPINLFADVVFVRVGRGIVGFDFLNLNMRLPQSRGIVTDVVNRLT